ncbi:hypothetical protein L0F63_006650 [Massospora cicadina]|nr:hypothetical protein L0F63_006650 [Massospora cicadina]
MLGALGEVNDDKRVIGYYASWTSVNIANLPFNKLTHVNFAFGLMIQEKVKEAKGLDKGTLIYLEPKLKNKMKTLVRAAKQSESKPKTLFSIGGWTGSQTFSTMVHQPTTRKNFIKEALQFLDFDFGFDGLDIDWEYPGTRFGPNCNLEADDDTEMYLIFLKELRKAMDEKFGEGNKLLTAAVRVTPFDDKHRKALRDVSEFAKVFDFVNIMSYDIMGPWSKKTGPNAPVYPLKESNIGDDYTEEQLSLDTAIRDWTEAGFPASKLTAGIALYGRVSKGEAQLTNGFGQATTGEAPPGDYPQRETNLYCDEGHVFEGVYRYKNLRRKFLTNDYQIAKQGYTRYFDPITKTPYIIDHANNIFISYEDLDSTRSKIDLIKQKGLGGAMVWDLSMDYKNEILNALQEIRKADPTSKVIPSTGPEPSPEIAPEVGPDFGSSNPEAGTEAEDHAGVCVDSLRPKDGELFLSGICVGTQYACANKEVSPIFNECLDGRWVQKSCQTGTTCAHTKDSIFCMKPENQGCIMPSNNNNQTYVNEVEGQPEPFKFGDKCIDYKFMCVDSLNSPKMAQCNRSQWVPASCQEGEVCLTTPTSATCVTKPAYPSKRHPDDVINTGHCDGEVAQCVNPMKSNLFNQCTDFHWRQKVCGENTVCQDLKEGGIRCVHPHSKDTPENNQLPAGRCNHGEKYCFGENDHRFSACDNGSWITHFCDGNCHQSGNSVICTPKPKPSYGPTFTFTDRCTSGHFRCINSLKSRGYSVCDNESWVERDCASGTVCNQVGNSINCVWPSHQL